MKNRIPILQWHDAAFACPVSVFAASTRAEDPQRRPMSRIRRANDRPVRPVLTQEMSATPSCF